MSLAIAPLNLFTLEPFRGLIAPALFAEGFGHDPGKPLIGAYHPAAAAGVALLDATLPETAHLRWLFVREDMRRQGIGSALLDAIERAAVAADRQRLRVLYPTDGFDAAWTALLGRAGFTLAQRSVRRYTIGTGVVADPWFERARPVEPLQVFPWVERSAEQRQQIAAQETALPAFLRPSSFERDFDPETSCGLARGGEVLAWLLTERPDPATLSFPALYVAPELRGQGVGFALVAEAVRRQVALRGTDTQCLVAVSTDNHAMLRFMRRLLPHVRVTVEQRLAEKALQRSRA